MSRPKPALKPSTTPISMRLPEMLLTDLKRLANEQDVPYQSLMKVYLAERAAVERRAQAVAADQGAAEPQAVRSAYAHRSIVGSTLWESRTR